MTMRVPLNICRVPLLFALLSGCATTPPPAPAGPPVQVKFTQLSNAALGQPYVSKRVRTIAAFQMTVPSPRSGWVGAMMYAATQEGGCEYSKMAGIGGLGSLNIVAPAAIGGQWADAKAGTIFEMVGAVQTVNVQTVAGQTGNGLILEVDEMRALGACKS